jgi:hypothetical protein
MPFIFIVVLRTRTRFAPKEVAAAKGLMAIDRISVCHQKAFN